jgi:hypothetical protein
MQLKAAIKKIRSRAQKVNREVYIDESDYHNNNRPKVYVRFEGSNQLLSFWTNSNGTISSPHVQRDGDERDPYTDYFAGCFFDNLTQALNYIVPLPAKYAAGSLVRFKENKRNIRHKLAGVVALVMEAHTGGSYTLKWPGSEDRYNPTYSERDLELINAGG